MIFIVPYSAHRSKGGFLDNPDLLLREPVQVIDDAVDLAVGGVNLALETGFVSLGAGDPVADLNPPPG